MSATVGRLHAFEEAKKAGREPYKVKDLSQAEFGRKEIRLAEQEMPGLMAVRERYAAEEAACRNADHGQPAHDDSDGSPDRNACRTRRRCALGFLQHLLDAGSRGRGRRCRTSGNRRHAGESDAAFRSSRGKAKRSKSTGGARRKRCAGPMTPARSRSSTTAATPRCSFTRRSNSKPPARFPHSMPKTDPEEWGVILDTLRKELKARPGVWSKIAKGDQGRFRRNDDRRASPLSDGGSRQAALPCHQRQRLGDEEQVRQHLRLPSLAARWIDARDRRHARRKGCRRSRIRRSRQGLRAGAARPGLPRDRDGNRSDLRAAGGDGRLRSEDRRRRRFDGRHLHHDDRQQGRHHDRAHVEDEGQGDRRQHRSLRQRNRHGRAEEGQGHRDASTSSRNTTSGSSPMATA